MVVAFPYSTQVDLELPQFMVLVIVNLVSLFGAGSSSSYL